MKVTFRVTRFDPEKEKEPRFQEYEMEAAENMSVLEALFHIMENLDGSLSFRYSCRGAICGSCAMYINKKQRLACQTLLGTLKSSVITVEPLPHLKVIKDLIVDMEPFFDKYESVKPYMICHGKAPEKEIKQTIKDREKIDEMTKCILCGACYSSCSMAALHADYLGPAALTKAYRFLADSRDGGVAERLGLVGGETGVFRCHTLYNCAEVCPKEIVPTYSIQKLKGAISLNLLK